MAALCLILVGLAAYVVAPKGGRGASQHASARQLLAMQSAALGRLRFPGDFVPIDRGCVGGRCYFVAAPAGRVAAIVSGLLRSVGVQPPGRLKAAEPVSLLRLAHWSTTSADPLVVACRTGYTPARMPLSECQDGGRVGQTLVNILIRPYQPCHNRSCSDPTRTEVFAWAIALPSTQ